MGTPPSCAGLCCGVKNKDGRGPDISFATLLGMNLFSGLQLDRKRQGKSGILTKLQEKNNILIFCCSANMAPVLWDYQAKLDIWCGDSSDGMRMTTSELVTPGLLHKPTGRNGYFQGRDLPYPKEVIQTHITGIVLQIPPGFSAELVSSFHFTDTKKKCNIYYKPLL